MSNLGIDVLPPGRYDGVVKTIRYTLTAVTKINISYKLTTPNGPRGIDEDFLINAPPSSALHFKTTRGLGRVEDILRTKGLSLADAQAAGGLMALPRMLEGTALGVVTQNRRTGGFDCPIVIRVEKP